MPDVVVVSNRGPLSFRLDDHGDPVPTGVGGGLASTLHPLLTGTGALWIAAAMGEGDRVAARSGLLTEEGLGLVYVDADPETYRMAYDVVSNATLWFCHHQLFDLPRRPRFDRHWHRAWEAYRTFNDLFADAVAQHAPEGAAVLVQDYHLSLVGRALRLSRPDLRTVHFTHTPFAEPGALRVLPTAVAAELLGGMAGFSACGFHTARWERHFRSCYEDPELAPSGSEGPPPTFHSPLGPDPEAIRREASTQACREAVARLDEATGDRSLVVRVDRVELSKNILRGCLAFEELLATRPQWRERAVLLALAYPSREGLPEYLAYRSEVEHAVARINEAWGTPTWTPILLEVADARERSLAALTRYDVLLVNPVRDGLNLVAKEGAVLNEVDGVLVVSREAGAWDELAGAAVGVNPFDLTDTADALERALTMDPADRAHRARRLRELVLGRTAADWLDDQLATATGTGS